MRARYYDPVTSRFLSQDPIGFAGGDTNLYRYVGNSAPNAIDPSGNVAFLAFPSLASGLMYVGGIALTAIGSIWADSAADQMQAAAPTGTCSGGRSPGGFLQGSLAF